MAKKKSNKVVLFDCETGGLDPKLHTCLSMGFIVFDMTTFEFGSKLHVMLKEPLGPNGESTYHVTSKALAINKIDLKKHDSKALDPEEAVGKINDFLKKNFKGERPILAGQNTPFDMGFLNALYAKVGVDYQKFFHYHYHDSLPILRFLAAIDVIPASATRLDGARKHFEIKTKKGRAHDALDDCEATGLLFAKLVELMTDDGGESDESDEEEAKEEKKPSKKKSSSSKKKSTSKKKKKKEEEEDDDLDLDEDDLDLDDDEDEDNDDAETPEELEDDEDEDEDEEDEEEDEGSKDKEDDDDFDDWDDDEDEDD